MIVLTATADTLRVTTGSAADIECYVSYIEVDSATPPVVQDIGQVSTADITTATTTNILTCTTASRRRRVMYANIHNNSATSTTINVELFNGTTARNLVDCTLLQNESLVYNGATWLHYDANGALYPSVGNAATQAEMEAGTATNKYVTPQGVNWHPGVAKFWVLFTGNTTTILASWNVTSITDGTSEATVTIATDFSSASWVCQATAEGASTTAAAWRGACVRAIAAGTIIVFCVDGAATTALQDPTRWHVVGFGDQ